jgi:RHS repeat-associated protein
VFLFRFTSKFFDKNILQHYPHGSTLPGRNYISATAYDYAYQGQEKDTETGYLNFDLRQYDPRIGRWFNPDPMGQYHSPYLAMGNNPVNRIDPTGGKDGNLPPVEVVAYQYGTPGDPYGLLSGSGGANKGVAFRKHLVGFQVMVHSEGYELLGMKLRRNFLKMNFLMNRFKHQS